jgi:hypothetical protein
MYTVCTGFSRCRLGSVLSCNDHDDEPSGFITAEFIITVKLPFKVSFGSSGFEW